MSCNSCSNITLPGVAGPTGAVGDAGATGPSSTITVGTVTSGTPAAVVDVGTPGAAQFNFTIPPGAAGPIGPNGTTLLKSITSEVETDLPGYTSVFSHSVIADTLSANEDTLRFEGTVLNTFSDDSLVGLNIQFAGTSLEIGLFAPVFDYPNIETKSITTYEVLVDIVRVSSSSVRIESVLKYTSAVLSSYAGSYNAQSGSDIGEVRRSSQVISGLDLVGTAYPFEVKLRTDSASRPTKLTVGKLYLLNK